MPEQDAIVYNAASKTLKEFHLCPARHRAIVGPVGSGKSAAASWEVCYYLPLWLAKTFGIKRTKWCVMRNTMREMENTTQKTLFEWFRYGDHKVQKKQYFIYYDGGIEVEIVFYGCDNLSQMKSLRGLELTGFWIDESIEVPEEIIMILETRIGRYPKAEEWPLRKDAKGNQIYDDKGDPEHDVWRFGIETTNPPDVDHPLYGKYAWASPPPGPIPSGKPLEKHIGFWQKPGENSQNLASDYYKDLRERYRDYPDWVDMYVDGKPGIIIIGKLVYNNFDREAHVAKAPLIWSKGPLFRGWDNSGNVPACLLVQVPRPGHIQVLKEFVSDKSNIVDFTKNVVMECNTLYPGATYTDWDDPAGHNDYSARDGGFTSNAKLMDEAAGVQAEASDNNLTARINSVDSQLRIRDGVLIDPTCTRYINGFLGGYCYPKISGTMGRYSDMILKNRFSHIHDAGQYVFLKLVNSSVDYGVPFIPKRSSSKTYRVVRPSF